ncbi:carbonyl reductase [NADPH] 1 [Eurytemora carolleeae]|uniref:carbonyl reductase [NADPH] 1 n=1 Tax=Eurytemora carolleeae TaxID=1294199 RepID=UPI000C777444|nr:carbonyl reductase [NADPH] 1 [Eurytemora carolleeae]|eukprot:XP_023325467.1 carbonyl reductase [NADPH] 1-like [Eurytemora affinis]
MKVAVVSGSNKGVGLGVVRGLCKEFEGDVYLTSRDVGRGEAAVKVLEAEGLNPKFHQLDIADKESVLKLRDFMKEKYGGIDVLVNNAAIAFKQAATEPFGEQATATLKTNYWDTKAACEILFPILRPGARVVNLSSSAGYLGNLEKSENTEKAKKLMKKLSSDDLSVSELDAMMKNFEVSANSGNHQDFGWINSTYSVSKIGLSALSRIQNRELSQDSRKDIVVNHVHPGYVDTDMTSHKGPLTIDQGAESSIYAALLPPGTPVRGEYIWKDCTILDWVNGPLPSHV